MTQEGQPRTLAEGEPPRSFPIEVTTAYSRLKARVSGSLKRYGGGAAVVPCSYRSFCDVVSSFFTEEMSVTNAGWV